MTTVERILNWGEWHTVLLACGHRWKLRRAELTNQQLFIGKPVACPECQHK